MKTKKLRIFAIIFPVIAIILELLPYGAVMNFAKPPDERASGDVWRVTTSYFDLTPFGYANFPPFITAVLSCVLLVLGFVYFKTERCKKQIFSLCAVTLVISLCPMLYGISYYSVVGGLISAVFLAQTVCFWLKNK